MVEKLLHWADANYSRSINLPCKPHAIIALNKSLNTTPDEQWDSLRATKGLMDAMKPQLRRNKTFRKYVDKWKNTGTPIPNMESLLRCYYSDVHVIRLPQKSRFDRLDKQRGELRRVIEECCQISLENKKEFKMLPNVDQFGIYLSLAFDHFSTTLDEPFDHVKASMRFQPPPDTLHDGLLAFSLLVAESLGINGNIEQLFNKLCPMVASCLMLDAVRKQRFGTLKCRARSSIDIWVNLVIPQANQRTGSMLPFRTRSQATTHRPHTPTWAYATR